MGRVLVVPTKKELLTRKEIHVLSTVLGFSGYATVAYPLRPEEAIRLLREARKIHCYHGHQPTLDLVNRLAGTDLRANRIMYSPKDGEVALAIKLNKRLTVSGIDAKPRLKDLDFVIVFYRKL